MADFKEIKEKDPSYIILGTEYKVSVHHHTHRRAHNHNGRAGRLPQPLFPAGAQTSCHNGPDSVGRSRQTRAKTSVRTGHTPHPRFLFEFSRLSRSETNSRDHSVVLWGALQAGPLPFLLLLPEHAVHLFARLLVPFLPLCSLVLLLLKELLVLGMLLPLRFVPLVVVHGAQGCQQRCHLVVGERECTDQGSAGAGSGVTLQI